MPRPGPHGVAIASQCIYFLCDKCAGRWRSVRVVSLNIFLNDQKTSIYLCFLEPYGSKLQLAYAYCAFKKSHFAILHNQTNSDIPTPEYNVFSEEMSLWSHRLWKSTFWQEICHPLKLNKIQITKRKLKTSHRWGFEPITCHVWEKPFYSWLVRWIVSGFVARPYDWFGSKWVK